MKHLAATLLAALLLAGPGAALSAKAQAASPDPAPPAEAPQGTPAVVRIGTTAVMTFRAPMGEVSAAERAQVVQSRIDNVLLNYPYLTGADVKVLREGSTPVIYWGRFPIVSVDAVHAKLNNFSSPDILASAWADSLRRAAKSFFEAKRMPDRALYRNQNGSDYIYRRTDHALKDPAPLRNTKYVFSPEDLVWGPGVKEAGQTGFAIFVRTDAGDPPAAIYLGNGEGAFTEYQLITEEDQP